MIGVGAVAALASVAFVYRTKFGVLLRATAQDRRMAAALGIDVGRSTPSPLSGLLHAGLGGAIVVPSPGRVLGMGVECWSSLFVVVVIGGWAARGRPGRRADRERLRRSPSSLGESMLARCI